jgi:predicted naringenin-chalcone synthase
MSATILALATATPPYLYPQADVADQFIDVLSIEQEKGETLKKMYQNSAIHQRYSVLNDFQKERQEWDFWGPDYPQTVPGMSKRNAIYKQEAPKIALEASREALKRWGGPASALTHIISVSCTGVIAPGIEYYLMQALGLRSTVNRLGINFMGCFGAFKGLSVARAFALENPQHRILVVCTELCSLHLQADQDSETLIANSLFADGAAAAIIGAQPQEGEAPLWEMARTHSTGLENSLERMSWEASDRGFLMRLSPAVPVLVMRHIKKFVEELLSADVNPHACDWAIHPGGKSIIQAVEKAMQLQPAHTLSSWDTLANYGNMSSATFLFVLDHLSRQPRRSWCIGVAFGPGLSFEGLLLRLPQGS